MLRADDIAFGVTGSQPSARLPEASAHSAPQSPVPCVVPRGRRAPPAVVPPRVATPYGDAAPEGPVLRSAAAAAAVPNASARVYGAPIEAQARRLLSALATPGQNIANADAIVDYIVNLLVHTDVLSGLLLDLVRGGPLDRDLRHMVGILVGLRGEGRIGSIAHTAICAVDAALSDVTAWHTALQRQQVTDVDWAQSHQGRCPITFKTWAELRYPVSIDVGCVPCVCCGKALLQWMQVSMQTPGRDGCATHPLDRTPLSLGQIKAVAWRNRPKQASASKVACGPTSEADAGVA